MDREIQGRSEQSGPTEYMGLVGRHPAMQRVFQLIRKVGPAQTSVLITGESGTGKELVAQAIHRLSPRKSRNFVPVHCGAIPEDLLESELFGHVKGAFTGALAARTGRFQLAHGGTVFLDEIGEMSSRFQVKLLRVLEDGSFEPVGGTSTLHTDVRVVAATHRDLRSMAQDGAFREDLLYRLDVVEIHLPALRERREDIGLIAEHFLARLQQTRGLPRFELTPEARQALLAYDWPGNVRELRNVLERAAVLAETPGLIAPCDLPPAIAENAGGAVPMGSNIAGDPGRPWDFDAEGTDFYAEMEEFERKMIGRALQLAEGSKREAARLLQVNRTTLLEKLKRRGWELRDGSLEPVALASDDPGGAQELRRGPASFQPAPATRPWREKRLAAAGG